MAGVTGVVSTGMAATLLVAELARMGNGIGAELAAVVEGAVAAEEAVSGPPAGAGAVAAAPVPAASGTHDSSAPNS